MLSHERVWAAIDALAARYSLSASGLAKRAGLDSTAFNKSKRQSVDGRPRWPSTESLAKIIEATDSSLDEFFSLIEGKSLRSVARPLPVQTSTVPLIGFAQAGAGGFFDDAGFPAGQGWDLIELPATAGEGSYALEVQGDSMLPLYRHGDMLVVQPNATVRKGDRVVVKTIAGEVMAKVLEKRTAAAIELVSLNPDHPVRKLPAGEVEWLARIVWAGTPFFRPLAIESAVFESMGRTIAISGVASVPLNESCVYKDVSWPCGVRARSAFRMWLRGRALVCRLPDEEKPVTSARCRLAKQDAGAWLVANGWARAAPDGPYVQAEEKARNAGMGIFGAPPDTSSVAKVPDAPVSTTAESQPIMTEEGVDPQPTLGPQLAFPPAPPAP